MVVRKKIKAVDMVEKNEGGGNCIILEIIGRPF